MYTIFWKAQRRKSRDTKTRKFEKFSLRFFKESEHFQHSFSSLMQFYNANMNYKKKLDSLKPSIYVFKLVLKKFIIRSLQINILQQAWNWIKIITSVSLEEKHQQYLSHIQRTTCLTFESQWKRSFQTTENHVIGWENGHNV